MAFGFFNGAAGQLPVSSKPQTVIDALMNAPSPRTIGEGISALGDGFILRQARQQQDAWNNYDNQMGVWQAGMSDQSPFPPAPESPSLFQNFSNLWGFGGGSSGSTGLW